MKTLKRFFYIFLLLTKRLFKKAGFVFVLFLILAVIFGYGLLAGQDSGVLTIALATQKSDPLSDRIISDLKDSHFVRFVLYDSPEQAEKALLDRKADASWVFEGDLAEKIARFAQNRVRRNAFVNITERNSTVAIGWSRELLSSAFFADCSKAVFIQYARENVPELSSFTDEELLGFYEEVAHFKGSVFQISHLGSSAFSTSESNYLLSPVRGFLAVLITLGGLAASMYYTEDLKTGVFARVPERRRFFAEASSLFVCLICLSVVSSLSLFAAGLSSSLLTEFAVTFLYTFTVLGFVMVIRRLAFGGRALGVFLPIVAATELAVCPVFLDIQRLRITQYLLPPTYFVHATHNKTYLIYMMLYAMVCLTLCGLLDWLGKRIKYLKK